MRKIFIQQEKGLSVWAALLLIVAASIFLTFFVFYFQYYNMNDIKYGLENAGLTIFFLNFSPICLLMLLLFFLTGRLSVSFFAVTFITTVLTLINRLKIIFRQDPLVPSDFSVGTEALAIVVNMNPKTILSIVAVFIAVIVVGVLAVIFIKNRRVKWQARVFGSLAVLVLFILLNMNVYSSEELYESFQLEGNRYFIVNHYNTKGFVYCFIHQLNLNKVDKPKGYKKDELTNTINADYAPASYNDADLVKPHVLMIMGEAFSDILQSPAIDFTGYSDPMENFNRLKEEGTSGHLLVPHIGGGTSDTEFDMLTGMSKREIDSVTYAFRLISKSTESIAQNMLELGYQTVFIHPGYPWFYNRVNAYEFFGFENLYFNERFPDAAFKGGYINEADTITEVIDVFEEKRTAGDAPVFEFCVNIQNHGPYENKYKDWRQNFNTDLDLTETEVSILSNYYEGLYDQDIGLKQITDYLNELDEPAVLLYFGDHIPSVPMELLSHLEISYNFDGDFTERTLLYKTPFLIWQNNAYKQTVEIEPKSEITISSSFLGAFLLESIGFGEISPFTKFINELRHDIPVVTKSEFITSDGYKITEELSEEEIQKILLYKYWQYYKLYDE